MNLNDISISFRENEKLFLKKDLLTNLIFALNLTMEKMTKISYPSDLRKTHCENNTDNRKLIKVKLIKEVKCLT